MTIRSALYVDGFNLYHAVADLNEPFLKWCNLRLLAQLIIPNKTETIVRIVCCTAYYPGDEKKRWRHGEYIKALQAVGVDCVFGHYVRSPAECKECGDTWMAPNEKETDINLALNVYHDAVTDIFDKAYVVTADSDQAATGRFLRAYYPEKQLVTVAPPGRNFSVHIKRYANGGRIALNREHFERCVFPAKVSVPGHPLATRPREYDPPNWWVHPDKRPRR